jgi:putative protease
MPKIKKTVKKPVKKTVKKVARKAKPKSSKKVVKIKKNKVNSEGKLIGRISHYFSNIEVAVIDLMSPLKIGDTIRIMGGQETDFEQAVSSMQIEHEEVKVARKGDSVGMKVNEKVHEGYRVYKI